MKQLEALKSSNEAHIIGAPNFPHDGNNLMIEIDCEDEDGGFSKIEKFVKTDPYVKHDLVENYTIREFVLKASATDFDRLS